MKIKTVLLSTKHEGRSKDEQEVLNAIYEIRKSISHVYNKMNYASDDLITDSLSYELLALKTRHKYYTEKAKDIIQTFR